jgi:MoCo/4Fe-4S cofactor protein with predicted Tat translocation signal
MKTIPPPCPVPETGQKYWRSLDQLADTPEFRQWMEREFPNGASEFTDGQSRRHFVKLMSASFLLGGLGVLGSGCRRPEAQILPFSKQPEGYIHGVPQYFATAMPARGSAIPLLVKSNDGRPTKIEGNPEHPDSNGATDAFAQASILSLYDPDRAHRFAQKGNVITKEKAFDQLANFANQFAQNRGARVAFLLEQSSSPSRQRLQFVLQQKYPQARWTVYEPVDLQANRAVTGSAPYYKFDQAKVILSLDCDFVGSEADNSRLIQLQSTLELTQNREIRSQLRLLLRLAGVFLDLIQPTSRGQPGRPLISRSRPGHQCRLRRFHSRELQLALPEFRRPGAVSPAAESLQKGSDDFGCVHDLGFSIPRASDRQGNQIPWRSGSDYHGPAVPIVGFAPPPEPKWPASLCPLERLRRSARCRPPARVSLRYDVSARASPSPSMEC